MVSLNKEQQEAVDTLEGPLLILAGAGSGKTSVITKRIANLLQSGISAKSILALTFTNKAAKEMNDRVTSLAKSAAKGLTISTFHAFGVSVLKRYIVELGYEKNFVIFDQADQISLLKEILDANNIDREKVQMMDSLKIFSDIKCRRVKWDRHNSHVKELFSEYKRYLKTYNGVDFDDLIMMPLELFETVPEVLEYYQKRFTHIMVDEFQDTSLGQYKLVEMVASKSRNLCVVGDDDQSIYSWRGADYRNILAFEEDFPERKEIKLEQNYRSSGTILAAANNVIQNNKSRKEKELRTSADLGTTITLMHPKDAYDEAQKIYNTINMLKEREGISAHNFAVLVRTNVMLSNIEQEWIINGIPYQMSGGQSFFKKKEIRDILGYLRLMANPTDDVSFLRVINTPNRGIGPATLQKIRDYASEESIPLREAAYQMVKDEESPISPKIKNSIQTLLNILQGIYQEFLKDGSIAMGIGELLRRVHYRDYLLKEYHQNIRLVEQKLGLLEIYKQTIRNWEDREGGTIFDYLRRIALASDKQDTETEKDKIHLMTIHAAKGLEFHTVFLAGVEEGIIPHKKSIEENPEALEEERRLFYVAITRAKQNLFISHADQRNVGGETISTVPSPFLEEIPKNLLAMQEERKLSMEEQKSFFGDLRKKLQAQKAAGEDGS